MERSRRGEKLLQGALSTPWGGRGLSLSPAVAGMGVSRARGKLVLWLACSRSVSSHSPLLSAGKKAETLPQLGGVAVHGSKSKLPVQPLPPPHTRALALSEAPPLLASWRGLHPAWEGKTSSGASAQEREDGLS